jgi:hypothetical protein
VSWSVLGVIRFNFEPLQFGPGGGVGGKGFGFNGGSGQ